MDATHLRDEDVSTGPAAAALSADDLAAFPVRSSRTIAQLVAALAMAQGEIVGAEKDRENPHFKSKYADLASVWDACRAPLSKHGLAVLQPATTAGLSVTVHTILTHKSGEWIAETLSLNATQAGPQAVGSAITYARRYGLSAMVGIAPDDDDDGNAGNGTHPQANRNRQEFENRRPPQAAPRRVDTPAVASQPQPVSPLSQVGTIVEVKDLPSGAFAVKLNTGYRCATRDKTMADAARTLLEAGTVVELVSKVPRDPQYAPSLEEILPQSEQASA